MLRTCGKYTTTRTQQLKELVIDTKDTNLNTIYHIYLESELPHGYSLYPVSECLTSKAFKILVNPSQWEVFVVPIGSLISLYKALQH